MYRATKIIIGTSLNGREALAKLFYLSFGPQGGQGRSPMKSVWPLVVGFVIASCILGGMLWVDLRMP